MAGFELSVGEGKNLLGFLGELGFVGSTNLSRFSQLLGWEGVIGGLSCLSLREGKPQPSHSALDRPPTPREDPLGSHLGGGLLSRCHTLPPKAFETKPGFLHCAQGPLRLPRSGSSTGFSGHRGVGQLPLLEPHGIRRWGCRPRTPHRGSILGGR